MPGEGGRFILPWDASHPAITEPSNPDRKTVGASLGLGRASQQCRAVWLACDVVVRRTCLSRFGLSEPAPGGETGGESILRCLVLSRLRGHRARDFD
jgi:hypothetical protein